MMKPFDAYRYYNALKLHFGGKYDAIKYQFKTSANEKSFWNRKDKFFFAKIAKRFNNAPDLINYYVAHFANGDTWVGNMLKDEDVYTDWIKRTESLAYNFEQDLYKLEEKVESFDELFALDDGPYPLIIQEYLSGEIMLETVALFEKCFGMMDKMDKQIVDTIIWPEVKTKVQKYAPFITMEHEKIKKIMLKVFTS